MARCFITGIEVSLEDAYVLDLGAASRALRNLEQRVAAIARISEQLSPKDKSEVFSYKLNAAKVRQERRLVCRTVANALSATYPEAPLFVAWPELTRRGLRQRRKGPVGIGNRSSVAARPTDTNGMEAYIGTSP